MALPPIRNEFAGLGDVYGSIAGIAQDFSEPFLKFQMLPFLCIQVGIAGFGKNAFLGISVRGRILRLHPAVHEIAKYAPDLAVLRTRKAPCRRRAVSCVVHPKSDVRHCKPDSIPVGQAFFLSFVVDIALVYGKAIRLNPPRRDPWERTIAGVFGLMIP